MSLWLQAPESLVPVPPMPETVPACAHELPIPVFRLPALPRPVPGFPELPRPVVGMPEAK
ncbi:hypothetical protein [Mycobacterium sp. HUMS_1102779]|uniref:hypothetical protein n=1 Tax=Mycobacterium sp. HUMS_1102779 TaxID=3383487 RepID=UPI0038999401